MERTLSDWRVVLRSFGYLLGYLLMLVIVGLAVVTGVLRQGVVLTELYHQEIESWLEAETGVPIHFGVVTVELDGRFLRLALDEIEAIGPDRQGQIITLGRAEVEIDLPLAVMAGEWLTTRMALQGPRVRLLRTAQGRLLSSRFDGAGEAGPPLLLHWLLQQPRFEVSDAELLLQQEGETELQWHLQGVDLQLQNSGYRHQLNGEMKLSGELLQLQLEWFGDLLSHGGWDGQFHLQGAQIPLLALSGGEHNDFAALAQGRADFEFWGEWLSGQVERVVGRMVRDPDDQRAPGLASGNLYWTRQGAQSWQLQLEQLQWGGGRRRVAVAIPGVPYCHSVLEPMANCCYWGRSITYG